jgi:hypothetical protein
MIYKNWPDDPRDGCMFPRGTVAWSPGVLFQKPPLEGRPQHKIGKSWHRLRNLTTVDDLCKDPTLIKKSIEVAFS